MSVLGIKKTFSYYNYNSLDNYAYSLWKNINGGYSEVWNLSKIYSYNNLSNLSRYGGLSNLNNKNLYSHYNYGLSGINYLGNLNNYYGLEAYQSLYPNYSGSNILNPLVGYNYYDDGILSIYNNYKNNLGNYYAYNTFNNNQSEKPIREDLKNVEPYWPYFWADEGIIHIEELVVGSLGTSCMDNDCYLSEADCPDDGTTCITCPIEIKAKYVTALNNKGITTEDILNYLFEKGFEARAVEIGEKVSIDLICNQEPNEEKIDWGKINDLLYDLGCGLLKDWFSTLEDAIIAIEDYEESDADGVFGLWNEMIGDYYNHSLRDLYNNLYSVYDENNTWSSLNVNEQEAFVENFFNIGMSIMDGKKSIPPLINKIRNPEDCYDEECNDEEIKFILEATYITVFPDESIDVSIEDIQPQEAEFSVSWIATGGTITGDGTQIIWTAPDDAQDGQKYKIKAEVTTAECRKKTEKSLEITIFKNEDIIFEDPQVEAAVRDAFDALGMTNNTEPITKDMALTLTPHLNIFPDYEKITSLKGLEHFTNLEGLYMGRSSISDLSPLSGLTNLQGLYFYSNDKILSDLSALSNLTNLQYLHLIHSGLSDISALSALTNLQKLYLGSTLEGEGGNKISDISVLSNLVNLQRLDLSENKISDIGALSGLINLQELNLGNNKISDISVLSNLINLQQLYLSGNMLTNISVLSNFTNLQALFLNNNMLTNINALIANVGLGNGDEINIMYNPFLPCYPLACYFCHEEYLECNAILSIICADIQTLLLRGVIIYHDEGLLCD